MNLTDDYSQGAVIACQTLIGFDWMRGEIDLTPPRILCARTEQQPHLQSRHRKDSGLHGDGLHEQGRLGVLRGKANVITVRFDLRVLDALNRSRVSPTPPSEVLLAGLFAVSHVCWYFWGRSKWAWGKLSQERVSSCYCMDIKRFWSVITQMAKLWRTWIKARDLGCSCNSWQEMSSELVLDTSQCEVCFIVFAAVTTWVQLLSKTKHHVGSLCCLLF